MSAPAAPTIAEIRGIERFPSSRVQPCAAPWACEGIGPGTVGAYVGVVDTAGESGLVVVCDPCAQRIEAGELVLAPAAPPEPAPVEQAAQNGHAAEPRTTLSARVVAAESRTCWYRRGECGGVVAGNEAAWVQRTMPPAMVCGPCADEIEHAVQVVDPPENDGPVAVPHQPDPTEPADAQPEPETPADAGQVAEEISECGCTRVTKRAKFRRDAAGRPVHDNCGGVVREKHRAQAEEYLGDQPSTTTETGEETSTDDGDAGGEPPAGGDAGAGDPARLADGAARGSEVGGEGGRGAGEGDHGRDQDRSGAAGPGGSDSGDPAQPAHGDAVEVRGGAEPAPGHRAAPEGRAGGGARAVHEDGHELAPRPDGLSVPGWYAAFLAQPADDEPLHTVADFLAQPVEDEAPVWGAPVRPLDSDNYLGEFSILELLHEVGSRGEVGGRIAALYLSDDSAGPRVVAVPW